MSFDVTTTTNPSSQPRNSSEWFFQNHSLKPTGNEYSFLPPIKSSIDEDSLGDPSKKVDTSFLHPVISNEQHPAIFTANDQNGNGHKLLSIKMLTEIPPQQSLITGLPSNYVPINLEGQQPSPQLISNPSLLNSPSSLNLSAWSLNSPPISNGGAAISYYSINNGPDSYPSSIQPVMRGQGPSNLAPFPFRPLASVSSSGFSPFPSSIHPPIPYFPVATNNNTASCSQSNSNAEQTQTSKRRSLDGLESYDPYGNSSKSKRFFFSSYSPQIHSKKIQTNTAEDEDTITHRRSSFKEIPIQSIVQHLHLSQKDAAKSLGVSVSTLKRRFYSVRDQIGIEKWPTITTTTIQSSQQSLSNVLVKYPMKQEKVSTNSSDSSPTNNPIQTEKEETFAGSTCVISSSASCAPLQNN